MALFIGLSTMVTTLTATTEINIIGDSVLLINNLKGKNKLKNQTLFKLMEKNKELLNFFYTWEVKHVTRDGNKMADSLANYAMDKSEETTLSMQDMECNMITDWNTAILGFKKEWEKDLHISDEKIRTTRCKIREGQKDFPVIKQWSLEKDSQEANAAVAQKEGLIENYHQELV